MNEVPVSTLPAAPAKPPGRKTSTSFTVYIILAIIFAPLLRGWGLYLDLGVIAIALIIGLIQWKRKHWP